jgi:hypothetical protein
VEYEDFCSICGFALTTDQCSVNIEGTIIDFVKRDKGLINITLCPDCWNGLKAIHDGGMELAVSKSKKLKRADDLDIRWRKKDDEGDGVAARLPPA